MSENEDKTIVTVIQDYINAVIKKMTENSNNRIERFDKVSNAIFSFSLSLFSKPNERQIDIFLVFFGMILIYTLINDIAKLIRSLVLGSFSLIAFCVLYAIVTFVYIFILILRLIASTIELFKGESNNEQ